MADIELVIKIPEEIYQNYRKVWQKRRGSVPESCIAFGTPLPKGHGRLIDADALMRDYGNPDIEILLNNMDTIIEADKAESEVKE